MNSEERPATGPDRLQADYQHTVPARPVKAHFAGFRREQPSSVMREKPTLANSDRHRLGPEPGERQPFDRR
jgi:hypothetical protein